jgi:hypothetical protein
MLQTRAWPDGFSHDKTDTKNKKATWMRFQAAKNRGIVDYDDLPEGLAGEGGFCQYFGSLPKFWQNLFLAHDPQLFHSRFQSGSIRSQNFCSAFFAADAPARQFQYFYEMIPLQLFQGGN